MLDKIELMDLLVKQDVTRNSVIKLSKFILKHHEDVRDLDLELRKFAKFPDLATNDNLHGCLYALHYIFSSKSEYRSYFAVGLAGSVKCMVRSLREGKSAVVEKLVEKWKRKAYYPKYFFDELEDECEEESTLQKEEKEEATIVLVPKNDNILSALLKTFFVMSLPFFFKRTHRFAKLFYFFSASMCCVIRNRMNTHVEDNSVGRKTIRIGAPSVYTNNKASDDRIMWKLWLSQHYLSAVTVALESNLLDSIMTTNNSMNSKDLGTQTGFGPRGIHALLCVLKSCGFVNSSNNDEWTATSTCRRFLSKKSPWNWRNMLLGSKSDRHDKLMSVLRIDAEKGGVGQSWEIGDLSDSQAIIMTSQFHAHSVNAAHSFAQTVVENQLTPKSVDKNTNQASLLDVAGGSGCFSVSMALRCPSLHCTVFELPVVAPHTRNHIDRFVSDLVERYDHDGHDVEIRKSILGNRVCCEEGSMWSSTEHWPKRQQPYDAVLFSNVFHDWSFEQCKRLTINALNVLRPGGRIYIHEIPLDNDNDSQISSLLSLHMLIYTSEGAQRSSHCWCSLLEDLGCLDVEPVPSVAGPFCIITGLKPFGV